MSRMDRAICSRLFWRAHPCPPHPSPLVLVTAPCAATVNPTITDASSGELQVQVGSSDLRLTFGLELS